MAEHACNTLKTHVEILVWMPVISVLLALRLVGCADERLQADVALIWGEERQQGGKLRRGGRARRLQAVLLVRILAAMAAGKRPTQGARIITSRKHKKEQARTKKSQNTAKK